MIQEASTKLDVALAYEGKANTFKRAGYGSIVDITFVSVGKKYLAWKVSEQYTHSDHH